MKLDCLPILFVFIASAGDTVFGLNGPFRGRIIGGTPAKISEAPYQVELIFQGVLLCGGSIVASKHVVSAAHCLHNKIRNSADYRRNLLVKAGSPKPGHGDAYSVRSILIHPNFDAKTFDYDVSVVVILGEFNSERNQKAIPLATQKNTDALIGMEAMVTGFGRTAINGPATNEMMKLYVPIVSNAICQRVYTPSPSKFCAGYMAGERDACVGDSGGPLQLDGKLLGIVSYGFGCAVPGKPGVYVNVAEVRDWIETVVIQNE